MSRNHRAVGRRRGDKGQTNTGIRFQRLSDPLSRGASQSNYTLPLHATGLNKTSSPAVAACAPQRAPWWFAAGSYPLSVTHKGLILLAVPRGLEPPTFGLGKRCGGPILSLTVPPKPDLSTFFETAIPAHNSICHPIPCNWVAIWVATSIPPPRHRLQL